MSAKKSRSVSVPTKLSALIESASKILNGKNRNIVLASSLGGVLLLTGVVAATFRSNTNAPNLTAINDADNPSEVAEIDTADTMEAVLTTNDGVVEYQDGDDWIDSEKDMMINPGMSIRTIGAGSRAVVELADGSAVRIDSSTEVLFETLTESRVVISQESGHVYNRVVASGTRSYVVQTKHAQYQSVGTAFRTSSSGDEDSVEVFHSSVREVTTNLEASAGEKIIIKSFADPSANETVEQMNLQNIKEDRFITWNRDLDKENDAYKNLLGFLSDYNGPQITVLEPSTDESIEISAEENEGTIRIKGTTEESAKLTVRSKSVTGSATVDVPIDDNGTFTTPELQGALGSSVFEFIATDSVGNRTFKSVTYTFAKKAAQQEQGISLSNDSYTEDQIDVTINWGLTGMTTPDGMRVVTSTSPNPTYPGDNATDIIPAGTTSWILALDNELIDGQTNYVRVCRYSATEDTCDVYSNEIVLSL